MPFEIGKVFSPEMMSLLLRKQEEEKSRGMDAARLSLQARAQAQSENQAKRELALTRERMAMEGQDQDLRRKLALKGDDRQERELGFSMDRASRGEEFDRERFDASQAMDNRKLDLSETELKDQIGARERGFKMDERKLGAAEEQDKWERTVKHPDMMKVEGKKAENVSERNRFTNENQQARIAIAKQRATDRFGTDKSYSGIVSTYKALISAYDAQARAYAEGSGSEEAVQQAKEDMDAYMKVVMANSPHLQKAITVNQKDVADRVSDIAGAPRVNQNPSFGDLYAGPDQVPGMR